MTHATTCEFDIEQNKDAAADVLYQYSQFVMVCVGHGVRPSDLRLHLMKEISGIPTSLHHYSSSTISATKPSDPTCQPSSSGSTRMM
ncbi:hypothetical protein ZOSMA_64G00590 [Zostera marina]|uniref:Uncharacterized protein n=1 Tax=Zostera marina TaxID=29655 RepID=A0A0K9NUV7_ZOSMR|nr:hypothetical protein ZOSMA_64G00590 [Zostera marina]